jgi:hypothetical protein
MMEVRALDAMIGFGLFGIFWSFSLDSKKIDALGDVRALLDEPLEFQTGHAAPQTSKRQKPFVFVRATATAPNERPRTHHPS